MGSRKTGEGFDKVYAAASAWVERALKADDSLFDPGKLIWTAPGLQQLRERFLDRPDLGSDGFYDKLWQQMEDSPPEVYQLMAEVLYTQFLVIWHTGMGAAAKREQVERVLGWGAPVRTIPDHLVEGLAPGIARSQAFARFRAYQAAFIIEFVEQWKELPVDERERFLHDPWAFKEFVTGLSFRSQLLKDQPNTPAAQREALLHLVHPDHFEGMVSVQQKESIAGASAFAHFLTDPSTDVDARLAQIRRGLEEELGGDFDFYDEGEGNVNIRVRWDPDQKPSPPVPPVEDDEPSVGTAVPLEALATELMWEPDRLHMVIRGLEDKGQVIFQGPPGTGKTFVARRIAQWYQQQGGDFRIVQFHPSYSYEDFVEGYRPVRNPDGQVGYDLIPGPLRLMADQARRKPDAKFILVIDEINRGEVAKILGELYFLLEYRDEGVDLQYSHDSFRLPRNLWFIGTMNTTDRSIALVDAALRRRFYFFGFYPDEPPVQALLRRWLRENNREALWVADLVDAANRKLSDRHLGIGPSHFMKKDPPLDEARVRFIWEQAVMPYIEEQCFGDAGRLREFAYDRLMAEVNAAAVPSNGGGAPNGGPDIDGADRPEDGGDDPAC